MPKVFSPQSLQKFEDASASIPLRALDRAFQNAGIPLGEDSSGLGGSRRVQFRRYVASIDQRDPDHLKQLGAALGALVGEVAASKVEFLVSAAEADGFSFVGEAFSLTTSSLNSFVVRSVGELPFVADRIRRLHLLADQSSHEAVVGVIQLVESVCRTILHEIGEPAPKEQRDLGDIVTSTINALGAARAIRDKTKESAIVRTFVGQIVATVAPLGEIKAAKSSGRALGVAERSALLPRHARLTVGAAGALASFIVESYVEREISK